MFHRDDYVCDEAGSCRLTAEAGFKEFRTFIELLRHTFASASETTVSHHPTNLDYLASIDGTIPHDHELTYQLPNGKSITVNTLLLPVDSWVFSMDAWFSERYSKLAPDADVIIDASPTPLPVNVKALAAEGRWQPGKHRIMFANNHSSYGVVNPYLYVWNNLTNPDDTTGTKYLDVVVNAAPATSADRVGSSLALVRGLADPAHPMTYDEIFENTSNRSLIVVMGEEDNVYSP